jgi:hypothetical protein
MEMKLGIKTQGDLLRTVVRTLLSVHKVGLAVAADVLCLLCKKADPKGVVMLEPKDRASIKLTAQQFSNGLTALRHAGLISGSHNHYQLSEIVPYWAMDNLTLIIEFTDEPIHRTVRPRKAPVQFPGNSLHLSDAGGRKSKSSV